ncbi:FkbM family methyltransferase [Flavisolibacter sp. BT320]|nr:FkbM family methyltransferase [Flavisolibacter longurius]
MPFFKTVRQISRYINESPANRGQKLYRHFLALLWQVYKRTIGLPLISCLDNGALFILLPNSTNSTGNIYVKTYEAEYIYFLRQAIVEEGIILDIGAHMGLYTLLLKDKFKGGYCFEPSNDNRRALTHNLAINELQEKFWVCGNAVSSYDGEASLAIKGAYSGENTLTENGKESIRVNTVTIDSFLKQERKNEPVTLIKIDTEGHEKEILEGAKETLKQNRQCIVLFENSNASFARHFFSGLSYSLYAINKKGELTNEEDSFWKAYNLVAIGPDHPLVKKQ